MMLTAIPSPPERRRKLIVGFVMLLAIGLIVMVLP